VALGDAAADRETEPRALDVAAPRAAGEDLEDARRILAGKPRPLSATRISWRGPMPFSAASVSASTRTTSACRAAGT
jgi:hypothetical protein